MRKELFKKISASFLVIIMLLSYAGLYGNISHADDDVPVVENWGKRIKSYSSGVFYKMNEGDKVNDQIISKWLFYDTQKEFENLTCIRTGKKHDTSYSVIDLYKLEELDKKTFNDLFKNDTHGTAEEKYNHLLWEIENFYLFSENDTAEDKAARLAEYNEFIGATELPYGQNETVINTINRYSNGKKDGVDFTLEANKNEQLIKVLQNELLMLYVNQTFERTPNLDKLDNLKNMYHSAKSSDKFSQKESDYVAKIVDKFTNMEASKNADLKYDEYGKEKIEIEKPTDAGDASNNISGAFKVTNPYPNKARITEVKVNVNGTDVNNFDILTVDGNEISDIENQLSSNEVTSFRVRAEGLNTENAVVKVTLNVDLGDVLRASLLIPNNAKGAINYNDARQYLIDLHKEHEEYEVHASTSVVANKFDLALTKQVTKVKKSSGESYDGLDYDYGRLLEVDSRNLGKGNITTAAYRMDKSPVIVEDGCIVEYKITVYNEGSIDGFAEEITDYLPEELELVSASESTVNATYGWEPDPENPKIIRTNYLSSNNNENSANVLSKYNGKDLKSASKSVSVELRVNAGTKEMGTKIDNRAEISRYGYYADINADGIKEFVSVDRKEIDIDSIQNSVLTDANVNNTSNLISKIEEIIENAKQQKKFSNISYVDKSLFSYEDDDDIERLILTKEMIIMDLALRKWISKVDDNELKGEESREPSQNTTSNDNEGSFDQPDVSLAQTLLGEGTLLYDNPKLAVDVCPGSTVTYKIAIYNEGTVLSYAKEITDYLPKELEFIEGNATNEKYGWVATKNSDGTTTVKTNYLADLPLDWTLSKYTHTLAHDFDTPPSYRIIEIVCKVSEDATTGKFLTNRAEITKYGYYNTEDRYPSENSEFIETDEEGIDRDSEQNTIESSLDLDNWYSNWYNNDYNPGTPEYTVPGEQDDDDFETVVVKANTPGEYSIKIKKVNSEDETETIEGAKFSIKLDKANSQTTESAATDETGITSLLNKVTISEEGKDTYIIKETQIPDQYKLYDGEIKLEVAKKLVNGKYVLDAENTKVTGEDVKLDIKGSVITIIVPNPPKEFDLALRKFITAVNGDKLEGESSRVPKVDGKTLINGDPEKNGEKTATYTHTKEPVLVNPTDIVEYTIRVYNEGELDGFASRIIDDVPEGVTMVAPEYDEDGKPSNLNAEYKWVMYKEMSEEEKASDELANKTVLKYADKYYVETDKAEEAVLISTDYLSKANGEDNLIKAFNGSRLFYKDIKVEFKVKATKDTETIITNYAQISEHQYKDGTPIEDRDSTPNEWNDDEDDQDVEHIKVNWFDLALYKWVSSTIVTEDGKTKEYKSGHTQDDKDKLVNVTIAKDKLDKTVVKFKWTIKVENQSPIPGYATELKDHIPAGLKFVEEDNKEFGWKLQKDGTVTTDYLKGTLLNEKETAEVTLVLTWINGSNNLGVKTNYAEISEDFNAYGTPDIDSTPDNFTGKPVEDDEDGDEVRLNVRTGSGVIMQYVLIATGVLAMVAVGVVLIKKNVLDREF